ncbi:Ig-like domain-containing protein [Streptomyces sp. NPDC059569]|uniref:Ig-like domain-containing protein n=1 Tax=Streptomyces sp. NPDC059569 TaxID=3346869 RepID=UPI0036B11691
MTRLARARSLPALLLCCALLMGAAAAVLGAAATASAAGRLGDLTLGRTTGSITDNPLVPRVTTDTACPEGQGGAVRLSVIHPTDSAATPAPVGNATTGSYDAGPIDTEMPENFLTLFDALTGWYGDEPHDGTYELRLNCVNILDPNVPPAFFTTNIEVTGDTWALAAAETTSVELTAAPEDHPVVGSEVTITVKVTPETAAGEVTLTSERTGEEPVALGAQAVENGTAVFRTTELPQGVQNIHAQFTPTDPDAYAGSSNTINGYTVDQAGTPPGGSPSGSQEPTGEPSEPADLDVVDADGNPLEANPNLEAGQKVTITARGYAKDATVKVTLAESDAPFEDATADADGTVQAYAFTVPAELADGDHVLTLAEDTADGHSVAFAFTTGEITEPTPEPSDSTGADGGAAAGTSGGDTGGESGAVTGGGAAGGSGGGSGDGGSLASTGTGVASIALASLALCFVGAAFVVGARRRGLLTFATPSGTPGD